MRAEVSGVDLTQEQAQFADSGIKALIPVLDGKTLLELILENLGSAGFHRFGLVIGPEHSVLRDLCSAKGLKVEFIIQDLPLGTADAVLAAEGFVAEDELFLAVNSDNLYPVESLIRLRETNRPAMLAFESEALVEHSNITADRIAKFATLDIDANGLLRRVVEKPEQIAPDLFVSMNAWLFSTSIFSACRAIGLSERGEYELTAAVQYAIDRGAQFMAVKTKEGVLDLSSRSDIESASRSLRSLS